LVFFCQYNSSNAPYLSSPSTQLLNERETGETWGHAKKSEALLEIGEHQKKKSTFI
jgi:hypothetical protein